MLLNAPICVELKRPGDQLGTTSRLNYAKECIVEHNNKICFIGKIHKASVEEFRAAYKRVQKNRRLLANDFEMSGGDDMVIGEEENFEMSSRDDMAISEEDNSSVHPDNRKFRY